MRLPSNLPIVQAPMAGGPSTPALAAAVNDAGGYAFLAAGYLSADQLVSDIHATKALTGAPFGVNLFVPSQPDGHDEIATYTNELQPEADRLGVALGEPKWEDDSYDAKLEIVRNARVHLVSFTFGAPSSEVVDRLHGANVLVAVTVTSAKEGSVAAEVGADLLAVQGTEAGGHQGSFLDRSPNNRPLLSTLAEIRESTSLPLIGAGGVMSGRDVAQVLSSGAIAAAVGTALLCTPQAGTSAVYREALLQRQYETTIVTRAYSGRFARDSPIALHLSTMPMPPRPIRKFII